jgi:Flagellar hook-length control protein FliK
MLNRLSDLVRLRTFADGTVSAVSRTANAALDRFSVGDEVRARIVSALPDGTVRATIGSDALILRLPAQTAAQPGDMLQLRVVTPHPQLAFSLVQDDKPGVTAHLSETARFITALLAESEKLPTTQSGPMAGILPSIATHDINDTPAALRDALAQSGMFYESHQAQWATGRRALATLLHEPQAKLAPLRGDAAAAGADARHAMLPSSTSAEPGVPSPLPELPVHRDALSIVRQQLDTLETRRIEWHGLIWNGQPLDWEVTEQPQDAPATASIAQWRTRLKLSLPQLGNVDATLLFTDDGVTIAVSADAAAAPVLAGHRELLRSALAGAGVTARTITVRDHERS